MTTLAFAALLTGLAVQPAFMFDLTREPRAKGSYVVEASVALLKQSDIFPPDYDLIRRIAYVESKDGEDPNTFEPKDGKPYHGGIWQMDVIGFQDSKDIASHPGLKQKHMLIKQHFKIDWAQVTWEDCLKPLYSMLAARLKISNVAAPIPFTINDQAFYWKIHFNTDLGDGNADKFKRDVDALNSKPLMCSTRALVMVVLDASGSIGRTDYEQAKRFASRMVPQLDIGPGRSKIAMLYFDGTPRPRFSFTDDPLYAQNLIAGAPYPGGGTRTGLAITMATQIFAAYKASEGLAKQTLVLTDGNSADDVGGPASAAQAEGITMVAIGIGSRVSKTTLLRIANGFQERVLEVGSFDSIDNIRRSLSQSSCSVPAKVSAVDGPVVRNLGKDQITYMSSDVPPEGITVHLNVNMGMVVGYGAFGFSTPNPARFDIKLATGDYTFVRVPPTADTLPQTANTLPKPVPLGRRLAGAEPELFHGGRRE